MARPQTFLRTFIPFIGMLIGMPLLGAWAAGLQLYPYLEFPPQTRFIRHDDFSWPVFGAASAIIVAAALSIFSRTFRSYRLGPRADPMDSHSFPWWGWAALAAGIAFWFLAWTRIPWMAVLQAHTFTPLWLAYIVAVNGLCFKRTGRSLMTHRSNYFAALFPTSAAFWWVFEYLNRFVQNWYYVGETFSAWSYFWYATLPFATVLPAVLSTQEFVLSFAWFRRCFSHMQPLPGLCHPAVPWAGLVVSAGGLIGIAVAPHYFFPLVWIAPILLLVALRSVWGEPRLLNALSNSDWTSPASAALAALLCGFFWELWNFYSLAKWKYSIPFVHRFKVFEMPLLGYFGYLPFGMECGVVGNLLQDLLKQNRKGLTVPPDV